MINAYDGVWTRISVFEVWTSAPYFDYYFADIRQEGFEEESSTITVSEKVQMKTRPSATP